MPEETFETWEESLENFEETYEEADVVVEDVQDEEEVPPVDVEEEEEEEAPPVEDGEDDPDPVEFPEEKQNKAFQEMRQKLQEAERKAQETSKYASLIQKIAEQNGTSPEKIVEEYERRELERQAESQNIPVEYLQKQQELENQIKSLKNETFGENIRKQAEALKSEHGISDEEVSEIARFMDDKGFPPSFSLSDGYFLMNKDKIIENQVKEQQQKRLLEKQEKRRSAALPQGDASVSQTNDPSRLSNEEYEAIKKELGYT